MLFEWILIGGIAFWIISSIEIITLMALSINRKDFAAICSLIVYIAVLTVLGNMHPFSFIANNWLFCLIALGAYVAVGIVWGFVKWFFFLRKYKEYVDHSFNQFVESKNIPAEEIKSEKTKSSFSHYFANYQRHSRLSEFKTDWDSSILRVVPRASDYSSRISNWMMFWPISIIWSILDDLLINMWREIYNFFSGIHDKMVHAQFKDYEEKPNE